MAYLEMKKAIQIDSKSSLFLMQVFKIKFKKIKRKKERQV